MYLKEIKRVVNEEPVYTTQYFLKTHRAVEGFLARIIFIGLRMKGIKYDQSQKIVRYTFLKVRDSLKKGIELLDGKKSFLIKESKPIDECYDLFLKFSVPYRNKIEHAVIPDIKDEKILKLCININLKFLRSLEQFLQSNFNNSVFDEPKKWGAKRSSRDFTDDEIKIMKLGIKTQEPIKYQEAIERFKKIK